MDSYNLFIPLFCTVVAIAMFCVALQLFEDDFLGVIIFFAVGGAFLAMADAAIYENGYGRVIPIERAQITQRLVVGQTYVVVGVIHDPGMHYYALRGIDGVLMYSSKALLPPRFFVNSNYGLTEIEIH